MIHRILYPDFIPTRKQNWNLPRFHSNRVLPEDYSMDRKQGKTYKSFMSITGNQEKHTYHSKMRWN